MRCRKARSYLSAYSNGELAGSIKEELTNHLVGCRDCRREEQSYRELALVTNKLGSPKVLDDFNSRLLTRIADERYKETRKKAYMPKRAPLFGARILVPAATAACLIIAFVIAGGFGPFMAPDQQPMMAQNDNADELRLDDRYQTVQPNADHVLTQHVDQQWEFDRHMARANRIRGYMNQLAGGNNFSGFNRSPMQGGIIFFHHNGQSFVAPLGGQPIIRNYITPQTDVVREVQETF